VTTWLPDPSHYPEQMTPLSATTWFAAMGLGLHEATREIGAPFGGFVTRTELGWAYECELAPEWEHDPDRVRAAALELPERWERELRPAVHAITRRLERMRPELPSPGDAEALLSQLWDLVRAQWKIHFLVVVPAQLAAELLHDEYVALYGDADPLAPYRLLEGIRNEADEALRVLADIARTEDVDDIIRELEPEHALERLRASGPGRRFLHELDAYLLRFGGRARWHELSLPREAEFPRLTLEGVRLALERRRPEPVERAQVPPELRELHARVVRAYALKELHTYDIDYPGLLATREALLGFGRRLTAEGVLRTETDVWMLEREELAAVLDGDVDVDALVEARREELARGRREGPKRYLGDAPPEADRHAALAKFYGTGGAGLRGSGASPGIAEGPARVVAQEGDFTRIDRGDILVATTTTPAWTPIFPSLAGLVTETGGILSHAAVVAREYGIPAVVGAAGATTSIRDGQRIRIDGGSGEIAPA
jgi:rifampicin phosphotransferase